MIVRVFIIFVLLAVLANTGVNAGESANAQTTDKTAVLVKRVPPRYPAKAIERGQEGWVDLNFTVTPEGTTSGIRVRAEYPRHVFTRSAINALAKWTYTPRFENSVAVPQDNNHTVFSFALTDSTAIRESLRPQFAAATDAIDAQDWDGATKIVTQVMAGESLNLFELASIEDIRGRIAFGRNEFAAAADSFARALEITARFNAETRYNISEMLVIAAINGGEFVRALEAFDRWNPQAHEQNRELRRTVEAIRASLAAGRPINLAPLAAPDSE